jgi:hypothetical protein
MSPLITGGCLCGQVRYEVRGKLRDVIACHCEQCRRTSGHFVAATACRRGAFALMKSETLKWYVAKSGFRRGFCSECGSSLFFEENGGERVSIAAFSPCIANRRPQRNAAVDFYWAQSSRQARALLVAFSSTLLTVRACTERDCIVLYLHF